MTDRIQNARKASKVDEFVGLRVRSVRRELGLTLQDLAQKLDMSFQQVQKYEAGSNRISAGVLARIASALKKPVQDFFPPSQERVIEDAVTVGDKQDIKAEAMNLLESLNDKYALLAILTVLRALRN